MKGVSITGDTSISFTKEGASIFTVALCPEMHTPSQVTYSCPKYRIITSYLAERNTLARLDHVSGIFTRVLISSTHNWQYCCALQRNK